MITEIELEIIDLPKGYPEYQYKPVRPTLYTILRRGALLDEVVRATIQEPLMLQIGDRVKFVNWADMPTQLMDLTYSDTGHKPYAVITTKVEAKGGTERSNVKFVG